MPRPPNPDNYDSMASAAARLKIPKELLSRAKADGAPGFSGSRIDGKVFLPWWNKNKDRIKKEIGAGGSLRDKKLLQEILRLELANQKAADKLIDKRKNDEFLRATYKSFESVLIQKICNELPAAAANQDAPAIQIMAFNYVKTCMTELKEWLRDYIKTADASSESTP